MSNEFTYFERQKLEFLLRTKQTLRAISKVMRRSHTILSREIRRNGDNRKKYRADTAQIMHEKRKHAKHIGKLDKYPELKHYVHEKLKEEWSPEEIAGRLKQELRKETISHETIYHYIYERDGRYEKWYELLTHSRPTRQKKRGRRKSKKVLIPERKTIHERPEYIAERTRFGDWESDSMIFTGQKAVVSVQIERKSRLVRIHKLENKSAKETRYALVKTAESVVPELFQSVTFDNGTENVEHTQLKKEYDIQTYFCDPFAPWQKGSVENMNKLIRRYLPRTTDLSKLSDHDIFIIQEKLNNRPRKVLKYRTPNEVIKSGAVKT